jgi:predicted 3-demethylubiquinone-9 3-methyltransferase (glyoxalase superfamily)
MVLTVDFTVAGQQLQGLDGGPDFRFNEAVSLVVECDDQAEVDRLWETLTANGGEPGPCGWLKDRYGLSWQIVPKEFNEMLDSDDKDAARRAMEAMLQMGKLDVEELRRAYEGVPA